MNRSRPSMMSPTPLDRYEQERPYGHHPPAPPLEPAYTHPYSNLNSPSPLERHYQSPSSPHHSNQSVSPSSSPIIFQQSPQQSKRRRVPTEERKRTAMSCDRCKSRKIKCIDPTPGPCMYCASSGHECKITMARKQRPFYYASEEQFRWLQIIASKINPSANLNDVQQLREIAESLEGVDMIKKEPDIESPEDHERPGHSSTTPINVEQEEGMEGVVEGIGTLMLDALGREKYIGESASAAFHRKVRDYVESQRPGARLGSRQFSDRFPDLRNLSEPVDLVNTGETPDSNVLETASVLGVSSQNTFSNNSVTLRGRLPPRHLAEPLIDRFFKQVHSIFWVFPPDQFMRRLDKTYMFYEIDLYGESQSPYDDTDRREIEMPSWMCCLYTVLALGCSTDENGHEILKPCDFFSNAKSLSRIVVQDESIQSIQALLLMSLYLANTDLRSLGWIFLGDAIRLAQLLGLHRNDASLQYPDIIERETRRRLWWTLYEFERFSSMANGCPSAIHDLDSDTALPSESLLSPGDYTPIGYLASSVALAQISGHIFQGMYSVPPQRVPNTQGNRISRKTITDLYGELVRWRHDVHPHLRVNSNNRDKATNPSVMRALAFLDLRFQYAVISVTRPLLFRLVSAVRDGSFDNLSKESQTFITTYSDICSKSARSSLLTLKFMHQNQLLNNVLWLDAFYILSTAMVLLLEYLRASSTLEAHHVNECISILRQLQPRGTGRVVLDSLSDLATFLGLDDLPTTSSAYDHVNSNPGDTQLYELFNSTPSSAATPGTGISSPEISVNGMGGFGVGGYAVSGGTENQGPNEFAWMDQIVRMAYAEFGPT